MSVLGNQVAVGCGNGLCRLFDSSTLQFIKAAPLPPALTAINVRSSPETPRPASSVLPAAVFVGLCDNGNKVVCLYGDASLFIWAARRSPSASGTATTTAFGKYRSLLFHSAGVQCLSKCGSVSGCAARNVYVSAASDGSVRFWRLGGGGSGVEGGESPAVVRPQTAIADSHTPHAVDLRPGTAPELTELPKNPLSKDMISAGFVDWTEDDEGCVNCAMVSTVIDTPLSTEAAIRARRAFGGIGSALSVGPSGQHVAVSDENGAVHIINTVSTAVLHKLPRIGELVRLFAMFF